jgi:hypothetical protein
MAKTRKLLAFVKSRFEGGEGAAIERVLDDPD